MREEDDLQSADRVLRGDRRAFEALVRRHGRRVFRVAVAILGNTEDAEEAMRDTFVKAFRQLGQFRRDARFTTWLTPIAVNAAIEKRKTRKTFVPLSESENADEQFLPKHFAPWKSNPEQVFGKKEQMLGIVRDAEPFEVPLAVSARLYSYLERIFSDT